MPLLFSLGIHDAIQHVASQLRPDEQVFAYLDDVYAICAPERVVEVYDLLRAALGELAGIHLHTGKTRVWNKSGQPPENVDRLGVDAWNAEGVKVLGTPIGTEAFVSDHVTDRMGEEQKLLDALSDVPDLQCAWQILLQCAGPRCNHLLRTLPPTQSTEYADAHDEAMWKAVGTLLGALPSSDTELANSRRIATLPMRLGGLGLRSARRTSASAYWASWADALPMINARVPSMAEHIVECLDAGNAPSGSCLAELGGAASKLDRAGFLSRPSWAELQTGK